MRSIHPNYNCLHCNKEWKFRGIQYANKYCNNQCQSKHIFETRTLPKFYEGQISDRNVIRKVLSHTKGYKCAICDISNWNDKPLVLQVDHINGRADNNSPENLRLICANCHSQTPHFGGANKGQGRAALGLRTN